MQKPVRGKILLIGVTIGIAIAVVAFRLNRGDPPPVAGDAGLAPALPAPAAPQPVRLSPIRFETLETYDEMGEPGPGEPDTETAQKPATVPAVRIRGDEVLAVVNGRTLSGVDLMPPSRFAEDGSSVVPTKALEEVLTRSIERELIFQQADASGIVLPTTEQARLDAMYLHLTGNPLNLPEGQTVIDLGSEEDAAFHVREQASRLLQAEMLRSAGEPDTALSRLAFRKGLREEADIQTVDLQPADDPDALPR